MLIPRKNWLSGLFSKKPNRRGKLSRATSRRESSEQLEARTLLSAVYHSLATSNFSQDWTNTGLITTSNDWSGVASIEGFRGDNLTAATGADPQTILLSDSPGVLSVLANQTTPNTNTSGAVAEFELANPVVAMQGSGTADAPYLQFYLDTTGRSNINVSYLVRDIDGSADNAAQQVALQYRVGATGTFTNVAAAYVADATTGGSATQTTSVSVILPAGAANQSQLQLRIMTTNAVGNDEWVGIDDIVISSDAAAAAPIDLVLDYSFDANNFFDPNTVNGAAARAALEAAASVFEARIFDSLDAITPGGSNTWTAQFPNPATGATQDVVNLAVGANQIIVYAGGRDLTTPTLGQGGPGGWFGSGNLAWFDAINGRGETGALLASGSETDFAPWGGAITFDTVGTTWNYGESAPVSGQNDFFSVALHELAHLLGFGTADSFQNLISGLTFTGAASTALHGSNPPVDPGLGHWQNGITSTLLGTGVTQPVAMGPSIVTGTRKLFTELDFAGLNDLGWDVTAPATPTIIKTEVGGTTVIEGGANDTITLSLTRTPNANVTVTLTPSNSQIDLGSGPGVAHIVTFTPASGLAPKAVTIAAVNDVLVEGNQTATITISTTSADTPFNALTAANVTANIIDNDFLGAIPGYTNDFATVAGAAGLGAGWTVYSADTDLTNSWFAGTDTGGVRFAEVNGFGDTAPANDWLISTPVNLDTTTGEVVTFETYTRFADSGTTPPAVRLRYSTNYSGVGDPTAATWTELPYGFPAENSLAFTPSGNIDVSGINGTLVWFAFQYTSSGTTGSTSTQWRVDNFSVQPGTVAPAFAIAPTDATKLEGNSGSTAFTFTVTRSGNTTGVDSVDYAVTGAVSNGANAADFAGSALPTGTVNFADGEVSKVITINVAGDATQEANEGFIVTLSNPTRSGTIGTAAANGSILDDDAPAPVVWINEFHYDNIGADVGEFVELSGTAGANLTGWSIVLYNGGNGASYSTISPTVTIDDEGSGFGAVQFAASGIQNGNPDGIALVNNLGVVVEFISYGGAFAATNGPANGQTSVDVGVSESNTTTAVGFSLQRKNTVPGTPGIWGGPFDDSPGTLNVFPAPSFEITALAAAKPEGNTGDTTTMTFTVTRSGDTSGANDVTYTVSGAAVDGANAADFVGAAFPSATLSFATGETTKVVTIQVAGDVTIETDEGFIVTLSAPTAGAVLGTAVAANGTIQNDDVAAATVTVTIVQASISENAGTSNATVTLSTAAVGDVIVNLSSSDTGEASVPATVTILSGQTTASFTVTGVDDALLDGSQTITISATAVGFNGISDTVDVTDDEFTATQLLLNEMMIDPVEALDTGNEFIELRGTANGFIPVDTYLVLLEGDSESGPGNIDHVFSLGGLRFGSNGYLVLRQVGSPFTPNASSTVVTATGSGWGTTFSSKVTDIENGSVSFLLIQSAAAPVQDTDADANNDGTLDGVTWTIRDSIGNIDGGAADTAYGAINASGNGNGLTPAGSILVNINAQGLTGSYHPDYLARIGNSTGSTQADWVLPEIAGAAPNYTLAVGATVPANLGGAPLNHLGATNNFTPPLALFVDITPTSFSENGGTTTVKVSRTAADISSNLVVTLNSSDSTEASVPATVTILANQTFATFTLSAVDDAIDDGTQTVTVTASSSGYNNGTDTIDVTDDETAGITLTQSGGSTNIAEGGATDSYTIVLQSQPTANVTVTITPDAQSNLGAGPATAITLTFTSLNWNVAQTVTVTAVDDTAVEGVHTSTITHAVTSSDAAYNGLTIGNVVANITDNDVAAATGLYINEILFNPPGTDAPNEYIEIRGTANYVIPSGVYLLGIEGDTTTAGDVQTMFNLSGMTIGSNGYLVLVQSGNTYTVNGSATKVSGTGTGFGGLSGFSADSSGTDIENASVTFLLIQTTAAPTLTDDIDSDNNGAADGAVFGGWSVLDGIAVIDNAADAAFTNVVYSTATTFVGSVGKAIIVTTTTATYVARVGTSTGSTPASWFGGGLAGTVPNWNLISGDAYPSNYGGQLLNHIGSANPAAPVAGDDSLTSILEDSGDRTISFASLLTNDTDPDGGTLNITAVSNAVGGTVSIVGLNVVFSPTLNFNGAAGFDYTLSDGLLTDIGAVSFLIVGANDAPVASTSSVTTNEDIAKTFAVSDFPFTDVESDSLVSITISSLNLASGDTLKLGGVDVTVNQTIAAANIVNLVYTPAANANGSARSRFGFTVNDAGLGTVAATMTINVAAVNDSPVFTSGLLFSAPENTTAVTTVTAADPDAGTTLTYSIQGGNDSAIFAINPSTGALSFATAPNFESPADAGADNIYNVIVGVSDGFSAIVIQPLAVTVTNVNESPNGSDKSLVTIKNTQLTISAADFGFSDPDGNALNRVKITTLPATGTLKLNGTAVAAGDFITKADLDANKLTFDPVAGTSGAPYTTFTFQVEDNGGTGGPHVNLDPTANTITITVKSNPVVSGVVMNGGVNFPVYTVGTAASLYNTANQKSQIVVLVVNFNEAVLASQAVTAFTLQNTDNSGFVNLLVTPISPSGGYAASYQIRFVSGSNVINRNDPTNASPVSEKSNSLADGNYKLVIAPAKVTTVSSGNLTGDLDFGDNYAIDKFFRLFGDGNGDGIVNSLDTGAFSRASGAGGNPYNAAMDYDGNNIVNAVSGIDRTSFLANFNKRRRLF